MELNTTVQVTLNDLAAQSFDILIAASGYETRSIFLAQRISSVQVNKKVVLAFSERKEEFSRPFNDKVFVQLGFEFIPSSMNSTSEIINLLEKTCAAKKSDDLNILIDYSSMPKLWYDAIISFFSEKETDLRNIHVWFSYTPSEYSASLKNISNKYFESDLPTKLSLKPKALVIGLGYEKGRAQELAGKLNAQVTYSFYSDPAVDPRFVKELLENNQDILTKLDTGKVIKYPIYDLNYINSSLTHLCVDLRLSHQIVLAPIGPKPFTLMCFLLNARYPDIKIWRFSSEVPKEVYDRKPHGELLVYKVHFTSDNVDYDD
jgi:hypothetical protein